MSSEIRSGGTMILDNLGRFIPEPASRVANVIGKALGAVGNFAGINPEYSELLQKQLEAQQQLQLVSMESNLQRSQHETEMATIRNLRVG